MSDDTPAPDRTYRTTLREIFTPSLDRFTEGPYQGNHRDLVVAFTRTGNTVEVTQWWNAGELPGDFKNRHDETLRIDAITDVIRDFAAVATNFTEVEILDDLPEGFSLAEAITRNTTPKPDTTEVP